MRILILEDNIAQLELLRSLLSGRASIRNASPMALTVCMRLSRGASILRSWTGCCRGWTDWKFCAATVSPGAERRYCF